MLVATLLAIFTGPFSYLYVKKYKKMLVCLTLMFVPYLNYFVVLFIALTIHKDVKKNNIKNFNETKFGLITCKCGNQNKRESQYCAECGHSLTKECGSCYANVNEHAVYCNYCGFEFEKITRKKHIRKKTVVIGATSIITLLVFSIGSLIALEQHEAKTYLDTVKLVNFEFPKKTGTPSFHIHYELSEKRPFAVKTLEGFITGDVYTKDSESAFDGKNIEWVVHINNTNNNVAKFNVTLYDGEKLLDLHEFEIEVVNN